MNIPLFPLRLVAAALSAGFVFTASLHADTIYQSVNSSSDSVTWNNSVWGSPAATPSAGNDYIADGAVTPSLRTGNYSNSSFLGDSLTMRNGSTLVVKTTNVTGHFILESGAGIGMSENGTDIITSASTILVASSQSASFGSGDSGRRLVFDALISGAGNIDINQSTASSGYTGEIIVRNAGNTFSGTWTVTGGILTNYASGSATPAAQAFGTADFVVGDHGTLDIRSDFGGPTTTSSLTLNTGGLFDLNNGFGYTFQSVTVGGTALAAGTYTYADLAGLSLQDFFILGDDTLTVLAAIPEPAACAFVGGLLALTIAGLRRRRA